MSFQFWIALSKSRSARIASRPVSIFSLFFFVIIISLPWLMLLRIISIVSTTSARRFRILRWLQDYKGRLGRHSSTFNVARWSSIPQSNPFWRLPFFQIATNGVMEKYTVSSKLADVGHPKRTMVRLCCRILKIRPSCLCLRWYLCW